jgi:NAD(P)-dependent dehydrogenase (short-subunit alcohol dehydrogenase family)
VIALTRELALEGGPHGIRANSISPGIIDTPATAEALAQDRFREEHLSSLMLQRIGTAEALRRRRCSWLRTRAVG